VKALRILPEGFTEFMVHPGFCTNELRASQTRLHESRQRELEALISSEVRRVIAERGIQLTSFRDASFRDSV
jgi:chitin disaccharide deacetylase